MNLVYGGKGSFTYINNNLPNGMQGKNHSEETKRKISEAHKGKKGPIRTQETRDKLSKANKGHIVTKETRQKIREKILLKYKNDPSYKEKLRQANLGKKYSEEINKKKGRSIPNEAHP